MTVRYCDMCRLRGLWRDGATRYGLHQRSTSRGGVDLCDTCWEEHAAPAMDRYIGARSPMPWCQVCRKLGGRYTLSHQVRDGKLNITRGRGSLALCDEHWTFLTKPSASDADRRRGMRVA